MHVLAKWKVYFFFGKLCRVYTFRIIYDFADDVPHPMQIFFRTAIF